MHLIVAIQEELPNQKMTGPVGDFVRRISSKQYKAPFVSDPWAKVRPREIRLFDFTIPEAIEEEVLKDLVPYVGGQLNKLSTLLQLPILGPLMQKTLKLKAIDMKPYQEINKDPLKRIAKDIGVRIAIIGKLEDKHNEQGVEMI